MTSLQQSMKRLQLKLMAWWSHPPLTLSITMQRLSLFIRRRRMEPVIAICGDTTMLQVDYSRTSYSLRLQQLEDQLDLLTKGAKKESATDVLSRFTLRYAAVLPFPRRKRTRCWWVMQRRMVMNKHATELGTLISGSFGRKLAVDRDRPCRTHAVAVSPDR